MTSNAIQPSKARPVIFSLLTLLSGIVIGAGATLLVIGLPPKETPPPGPEYFSHRMVEHMTRELALTTEQQQSIQSVIQTHMTVIDEYREEARPKIREELDTMNTEIMSLLDENQQQMWKDSIEQMQQRFKEARERRDRGPRDREGFRGSDRDPNSPGPRRRFSPDGIREGKVPPPPDREEPPEAQETDQSPVEPQAQVD